MNTPMDGNEKLKKTKSEEINDSKTESMKIHVV